MFLSNANGKAGDVDPEQTPTCGILSTYLRRRWRGAGRAAGGTDAQDFGKSSVSRAVKSRER